MDADLERAHAPARAALAGCGREGFLTLNILVGGNVLTALTFPILAVNLVLDLLARYGGGTGWIGSGPLAPLHLTTIMPVSSRRSWSV